MDITLRYHPAVVRKDIPALSRTDRERIKRAIEKKLATHPEMFGEPLRGRLTPFWKLRVGDWRVVYEIEPNAVYIHAIGHRSNIYTRTAPLRPHL